MEAKSASRPASPVTSGRDCVGGSNVGMPVGGGRGGPPTICGGIGGAGGGGPPTICGGIGGAGGGGEEPLEVITGGAGCCIAFCAGGGGI
jgi:hypothetical protein